MFVLAPLRVLASVAFVSSLLSFAPHVAAQCDPPKIDSHPVRATVCAGSPASFAVSAAGTGPLSYQWRKDNVNIPGATSALYLIAAATAADDGGYDVAVTNACGAVISARASLTVDVAPSITGQPSSATACLATPASFSVTAAGTAPLSYQWQKDGADILGASGATHSISAVTAAHAGSYRVVVKNACGVLASAAATLTVATGPSITSQPSSLTVCAGSPAAFAVSATGTTPLGYQWRKNGNDIGGATGASYSIGSVTTADAGSYDVVVTNACGQVTATAASLAINLAPTITSQPSSSTVCAGSPASFAVSATGTAPLGYQWRKNGNDIGGATGASYSIAAATTADAGSYDVVVTNACGGVTSAAASLTVDTAPTITSQPSGLTVCAGSPAAFAVSATGTAPLAYQWRRNGNDIGGATGPSHSIAGATTADAGSYDVVVTNACGGVTSAAASFTVDSAPTITGQPSSATVCAGSLASFAVSATGTAPLGYQWRKNGNDIGGATSASYSIAAATTADAGSYDVVVTNACGSDTSAAASLTINLAPTITSHPSSLAVCAGSPASFAVSATGTAPLAYQWRKNGNDIGGATGPSHSIPSVTTADAGSYDVVVTNACGGVSSAPASLTVDLAPTITSQPSGRTVCAGSPASFAVSATGTAPLAYQWRKGGNDIGGATSASYSIAAPTTADAGSYDVVVTNACGSVVSSVAPLTVNEAPVITTQPMSHAVCVGATVTLSVVASGASNTYQWQKDLVPITGATSTSFVIASAQVANAGTYAVIVVNPCGRQTSNGAVVAVDSNVRITSFCLGTGAQPRRALAVDLDGVNGQDMVLAAYASGTLEVALNNSASALVPHTPVPVAPGLHGLAAADFDGDGRFDVAVTNRLAGNVTVLYGDGTGGFATTFVVTTGGDPIAVAATPVLGHVHADLVVADAAGRLLVAGNDANTTPGARTFGPAVTIATGGSFTEVAAADVVGSSAAEVVATNAATSVVHVLDAATLSSVAGSPWGCATAPTALAVLDVNGDGKADPIVGGAGGVTVLQTPMMAQNAVWGAPVASVTAGNLDGDGKADLALVAASGQVLLLHGYNNGAPPDSVEAGSCLLNGTHITTGKISRIGLVGSPVLNTDELLVVRGSLDLACVLRFRTQQRVQTVAGSGCPGFADTGSVIGLPTIGNAGFTLTLSGAYPSTFTMMLIQPNMPAGSPPPLFPIGPCQYALDLLQSYTAGSTMTNTMGQAFLPLPIPNSTAFVALELRWQWLTVDPNGPVMGSVTFSTANLLRIGEF